MKNLITQTQIICLGIGVVLAVGCTPPQSSTQPDAGTPPPISGESTPAPPMSGEGAAGLELVEESSPAGGTMAKVYLPGPETAVIVECEQEGFTPFFFIDVGEYWVGCQSEVNASVGPEVDQPIGLQEVSSPAGGMVQKLSIPGPQLSAAVGCEQDGFVPFLYDDEGATWVGCQAQ
ncbi:hypothetical protein [Pseudanabaena sp. FACHB-2040]|uniref:hypothetical protein n=1 Tax=Pseudanabaena sp. FACHB-2040 TaxID=2692859 RepID=UPI001685CFB2|nr:hypothetical protein [Pseudanabaena sp. FACHB-2040]MBD2258724.1 hypothetical protein [Pseudanabaena sp. FACHB-2040]